MIVLFTSVALAVVTLSEPPQVGEETTVVLTTDEGSPIAGATVRAFHDPDLPRQEERAIGVTDQRGAARWTPDAPGRVRIQAGKDTLEVSVPWPSPPTGAVVALAVIVLAGLGSLLHGLRRTTIPR